MAIALVNVATNASAGSYVTELSAPATSHTSGNLLVVAVRHGTNATATISISDTAGNSFVVVDPLVGDTNIGAMQMFYAKNITGNASNVVKATLSDSCNWVDIIVVQYSGIDTTSPLDAHVNGHGSRVGDIVSPSFSTAQAEEVIVFAATVNSGAVFSAGSIGGEAATMLTAIAQSGVEHLKTSATKTNVTAAITPDGGTYYLCQLGSFKAPVVTNRQGQVSWTEFEIPTAPRKAQLSWTEFEVPSISRGAQVSWTELEIPTAPRRAAVCWAEFETPFGPRRGLLSWVEFEVPPTTRHAQVSWSELEVPLAPARGCVSWSELEVPNLPGTAFQANAFQVSAFQALARHGLVSWAELEVPTASRKALVSWAEMESPFAPRKAVVSWVEFETPVLSQRSPQISWAEMQTGDAPRRGLVSWSEFETPDAGRRAQLSWTEFETGNPPRRASVAWAELELPQISGPLLRVWLAIYVHLVKQRSV